MKKSLGTERNRNSYKYAFRAKANFTQVPNQVLGDSTLSIPARFLFIILLKYMMQKEFCFPSQDTLAKDLGYSPRHIRNLLKELDKSRYIRKIRSGYNRANTYIIGPALDWKSTSPHLGREVPDCPGSTFPTKNINRRIINNNNVNRIKDIKKRVLDKTKEFDYL